MRQTPNVPNTLKPNRTYTYPNKYHLESPKPGFSAYRAVFCIFRVPSFRVALIKPETLNPETQEP